MNMYSNKTVAKSIAIMASHGHVHSLHNADEAASYTVNNIQYYEVVTKYYLATRVWVRHDFMENYGRYIHYDVMLKF